MSASASGYASVFPSEWTVTDEDLGDDATASRSRSRSPSPPSRDDSTPTPMPTSKKFIPQAKPATGYLDHFPSSWALSESKVSPPPSPTPRAVEPATSGTGFNTDLSKHRDRHRKALSANPLDRFQVRAASTGGLFALSALQEQWQRDKDTREMLAQRRNTGWPDSFQRLNWTQSSSIPMRQKYMTGGTVNSVSTKVEINPHNLRWLERLKEIEACKAESTLEQEKSQPYNLNGGDKDRNDGNGSSDAEDDVESNITQSILPTESGYGDVPYRRPHMSDGYSVYSGPSVTN
ncbi:hypothetical protein K491DRAFT_689035 [Lophiostoma macrostomum CBS 122681]|uniref:Uncharacterized protein n=1 Tax=Lophiostoma macrostomum CBS 122681 TaxID=1314788 RepID=A0A6A6TI41_9PLEO|nr:hypothetical protein K491DRAFT_689035 [Lophiostoma macrostomum CBS 122681]